VFNVNRFPAGMAIVFEHSIKNDQEFSHARHDDHLRLRAPSGQSFAEVVDHGIAASGAEWGHIEHTPHRNSAPLDTTGSSMVTVIVIKPCDAHQSGNRLAIEPSQLGQFGHERRTGHLGDSWGRREQLGFGSRQSSSD
jgi:hypothetical protein